MKSLTLNDEEHAWLSNNIKRLMLATHGTEGFHSILEVLKKKLVDKTLEVGYAEARTIERLCEESIESAKSRIELYKQRKMQGNPNMDKYIQKNKDLEIMFVNLKKKVKKCL